MGKAVKVYTVDGSFPVHEYEAPCPYCEDGIRYAEVPGGRWNSYIGTWEPDEYKVECGECDGTGKMWVERCLVCGKANEFQATFGDDEGIGVCRCEEEEMLTNFDRAHEVIDYTKKLIEEAPVHLLPHVRDLPAGVVAAIAAILDKEMEIGDKLMVSDGWSVFESEAWPHGA